MICTFITLSYMLVLYALSLVFLNLTYNPKKEKSFFSYLKSEWVFLIFSVIVMASELILVAIYTSNKDLDALPRILKWTTLYMGLWLLTKTDFKERKIPNKIIIILLGMRMAFLIYEICVDIELAGSTIVYPLLGGGIGAVILFVAMLVSRKGVGMGDVKMFFVIGLFVGSTEIISVMFYTFLISAIVGIVLLCIKKAKLNDSVPMAPFAFLGMTFQFFMLMLGGYT